MKLTSHSQTFQPELNRPFVNTQNNSASGIITVILSWPGNSEHGNPQYTPDARPVQFSTRRGRWMKHAFLILLLVTVLGSLFVSRANSGVAARSAAQIYSKNCASCHGRDGRAKTIKGRLNHARNLSDAEWQSSVSDERIFNSIMNGKGKMPAYAKKLSDQEIDSLVPYVRGLKK